jgi:hypothetical protein
MWLHDYSVGLHEQSCTVAIDTLSCSKQKRSISLRTTPAAKHLVVMTDSHPKSENSPMPVGPQRAVRCVCVLSMGMEEFVISMA